MCVCCVCVCIYNEETTDKNCKMLDIPWRQNYNYYNHLTCLFSRTTWVSRYQKGKTNLDFTGARDSEWQWHQLGISKFAPRSRQITMPAPHHSVFYRPDALHANQPTVSKHWRQFLEDRRDMKYPIHSRKSKQTVHISYELTCQQHGLYYCIS